MAKYLRMVDHSGRGIKSLLPFESNDEREKHVKRSLSNNGATEEEIEDFISALERGEAMHFEATEYEYF